jgi:LPS sulfotransferase NodH
VILQPRTAEVGLVPRRSCLIVTTPRTGSWLLAEALHTTGLVGEPQEYFGWEAFASWSREFGLTTSDSHLRFVEKVLAYGTAENGIFSAKMHWSQLERFVARVRANPGSWPESPAAVLRMFFPDLHCVHLSRLDTARQAISYWRADQAQEWWDFEGSKREMMELDVDFQQIRWREDLLVRQDRNWRDLLELDEIPTLEVEYEVLVGHLARTVEAVLDFLEVSHGRMMLPPSRIRPQADEQTEEWLTVYRVIRDDLLELPASWRWSGRTIVPDQDASNAAG